MLSQALVVLEAAAALRPYLPTRYWFAWRDFFRDPILWHDVQRGLAVQAVYVVVFLGLAWANFATKDVSTWEPHRPPHDPPPLSDRAAERREAVPGCCRTGGSGAPDGLLARP